MSGIAQGRLKEERKNWRRDHPFGFWARPVNKPDGSSDLMKWEAGIPGKEGTDWEGGVYTVSMEFSEGESEGEESEGEDDTNNVANERVQRKGTG